MAVCTVSVGLAAHHTLDQASRTMAVTNTDSFERVMVTLLVESTRCRLLPKRCRREVNAVCASGKGV